MRSPKERLLGKVAVDKKSGCWGWTASKFGKGYGQFKLGGTMRLAHRASYEMHVGSIPPGMFVCHRCDNRACINPEHLFLGTNADNCADMVAKGRQAKHKLKEADVLEIRSATGVPQAALAAKFGVSNSMVHHIRNRKAWVWLQDAAA